MRKSLGVLLAVATLLPVGALAVSPAGAAAHALTCKKLSGTVTWSKPLPKLGDPKKVISDVRATGKFTQCSGTAGIASATYVFTSKGKTPGNCTTLAAKGGKPTTASDVVTWNNHKTSISKTLTLKSGGLGIQTISGKVSSGTVFVGKAVAAQILFTAKGTCLVPLKTATVALFKKSVLTIG